MNVERIGNSHLFSIAHPRFSPALVEAAKGTPGMTWSGPLRAWTGYADAVSTVVTALQAKGLRLEGTEQLPSPDGWRSSPVSLPFRREGLREYQEVGVKFLLARAGEGALLADGMRLGKSLQALVAARAWRSKTLVVCPSHVVGVWARGAEDPSGKGEAAKWWPEAEVYVCEGVRPERSAPLGEDITIAVVSYDVVYAWVQALKEWGLRTFILDECHALQSPASRRSVACRELASVAKKRIGLSGTPMTSRPRDLFNVIETLCPDRMGGVDRGFFNFAKKFCDAKQVTVGKGPESKTVWNFDGASQLEELNRRLSYFMLRRVKSEVDAELPPKQRQIVDVVIPSSKMIGPSPDLLSNRAAFRRSLDVAADGALKPIIALVRQHLEEGEKVVCATYRRRLAEEIAAAVRLGGAGFHAFESFVVHGQVSQRLRDERISLARRAEKPCLLAATIDVSSTGIDLSFASVCVVAELTWEPHDLIQLEERLYKFGRGTESPRSLIQYVIPRGTGAEIIASVLITKLDNFEKAIGKTGERMKEDLTDQVQGDAALKRLSKALVAMTSKKPSRRSA